MNTRPTIEEQIKKVRRFLADLFSLFTKEWLLYSELDLKRLTKKHSIEGRLQRIVMSSEFIISKRKYKRKYDTLPTDEVILSYIERRRKQRTEEFRKKSVLWSEEERKDYYSKRYQREQRRKVKLDNFDKLIKEAIPEIRARCQYLVSSNSSEYTEEDLLQDSLLKAIEKKNNFNFKCKVSTWVNSIAYNLIMSNISKNKVRNKAFEDLSYYNSIGSSENDDLIKSVVRHCSSLKGKQRPLIELMGEGKSYEEIAKILNCAPGTLKTKAYKIRKQLKAKINEDLSNPDTDLYVD